MISGQFKPSGQQRTLRPGRSRLLQQHPVLIPVILLIGAIVLCVASIYADTLFPLMALIGVPTALLCLSIAFVSGISGVLASIISIIEVIDRRLQTTTFTKSKELSNAHRN